MADTIEFTVDQRVATIRFNQPEKLNSITDDFLQDLLWALAQVRGDESLRALVLTGNGRAFSVGLDLALLERAFYDHVYWSAVLHRLNEVYLQMEALPMPVIAAVNGLARAGGYEFTLASDLVIIADEARIGDAHSPFGVPPGGGASFRLAARVGEQRAKELIFTGRWLSGQEAAAYGLALRSVPLRELEAATEQLLSQLRNKPRGSISVAKKMIHANRFQTGTLAVETELSAFLEWAGTDPLADEGMRAFVEKREPVWEAEHMAGSKP